LADGVRRAKIHHCAKFCRNLPLAIFQFFKMTAVHHVEFVWAYSGHPHRLLGGLYHCAQFGCYRCSSFDNMKVSMAHLAWKSLFTPPKLCVFGRLDP